MSSLGLAVIGAGLAGRAHAAAYRAAPTLFEPTLPETRLVSIADVSAEFGALAARRFGYERSDTDWRAIAEAPDIDVVSVVVANSLHREMVEGLLAAGKHVLCEKPLSDSLDDARAMAEVARSAGSLARIGFSFRRAPGIAFIRDLVQSGRLGDVLHYSSRYWADYAADPDVPISWRFTGPPGSGALADVGSHAAYVAEFICGRTQAVSGGRLSTAIAERPEPVGAVSGRGEVEVSDTRRAVENDDYAVYSARFAHGAGSLECSRVALGNPNSFFLEVYGTSGAARWDQRNPSQVELMLGDGAPDVAGFRTIQLGPDHPYVSGGLAFDTPGVGFGQNDLFVHQARAFLDEVAGVGSALPACATFDEGVHNMEILDAVARSAQQSGAIVDVPA